MGRRVFREGQYLKSGELVCEVTDLSNIWLVTQVFPEEASVIRYGQRVQARISSLPNQTIEGRVSFIAPIVDSSRRAVNVRIDLQNRDNQLRPGDEATVEIEVPLQPDQLIYDEELAGKFICPQHPDVVHTTSKICDKSGRRLVATKQYGFAASPDEVEQPLAIPRSAVLRAGNHSAVYVQIEDGEFEIRLVKLGSKVGDKVVVLTGLEEDEQVADSGNFLIDSQMQLSGKPSLIDPSKAATPEEEDNPYEIDAPEFGEIETIGEPEEDDSSFEIDDLPPMNIESYEEDGDDSIIDVPSIEPPTQKSDADDEEEWELPEFGTPEPFDESAVAPSAFRTIGATQQESGNRRCV
ncbi:MAG: efflux RND transporter periplasmic adaptor subunit [Planctomycetota bacterium]